MPAAGLEGDALAFAETGSGAVLALRPGQSDGGLGGVRDLQVHARGAIFVAAQTAGQGRCRYDARMRIDIWSDVVCPWCWIGKRRLQRGIALLGEDAPAVEVHWHPFLLTPEADETPVPLRESYYAKFGGVDRTHQILASTQATARAEGVPIDFDQGQVRVTTLPAHRLLWLAAREGDADAVIETLFHAHFAEGRNLAAPVVLAEAGVAGGLLHERINALFDGKEGLAEVHAALERAQAMGIRAVPSFVIDGRILVQGAQSPEEFAAALRQAMAA